MRLSFFLALPLLVPGTFIGTKRSPRDVVSLSEAQSKGYPHHKDVYSFLGPVHNVGFVNYSHAVNFASTTAFMHDFLSLLAPPGKTTCALLPPRPLPKVEGIRLASPTQPLPGEEADKGPPFSLTIEWQPSDAGDGGDAAARLSHRLETAKVMIFSTEASSLLDAASCKAFQTATKAFRVFSYTSGPHFWTLNLEPASQLEPFASAKIHSVVEHDTERAMAVRGLSWADFPQFQRGLQTSHTFTLNINSNNGLNAALSPIPLASFTGSSTLPGAALNASYAVQVDCVNCFASFTLNSNTELTLCQWQVMNVVIPRFCWSWWWWWGWRSACAGPWYVFSWSWPPGDFFGCDSQDTNEYNNVRYNPWNYWWYHMGGHVKFKQSFDLSVTANVGIRVSGQAKVAGFKTGTIGGTAQQESWAPQVKQYSIFSILPSMTTEWKAYLGATLSGDIMPQVTYKRNAHWEAGYDSRGGQNSVSSSKQGDVGNSGSNTASLTTTLSGSLLGSGSVMFEFTPIVNIFYMGTALSYHFGNRLRADLQYTPSDANLCEVPVCSLPFSPLYTTHQFFFKITSPQLLTCTVFDYLTSGIPFIGATLNNVFKGLFPCVRIYDAFSSPVAVYPRKSLASSAPSLPQCVGGSLSSSPPYTASFQTASPSPSPSSCTPPSEGALTTPDNSIFTATGSPAQVTQLYALYFRVQSLLSVNVTIAGLTQANSDAYLRALGALASSVLSLPPASATAGTSVASSSSGGVVGAGPKGRQVLVRRLEGEGGTGSGGGSGLTTFSLSLATSANHTLVGYNTSGGDEASSGSGSMPGDGATNSSSAFSASNFTLIAPSQSSFLQEDSNVAASSRTLGEQLVGALMGNSTAAYGGPNATTYLDCAGMGGAGGSVGGGGQQQSTSFNDQGPCNATQASSTTGGRRSLGGYGDTSPTPVAAPLAYLLGSMESSMPRVNISATVAPSPPASGTPFPTILPATLEALAAGAVNLTAANITISTPAVSTQWVFLLAQEVNAEPIRPPTPTPPLVEEGLRVSPLVLGLVVLGVVVALSLFCFAINRAFPDAVRSASSRVLAVARTASSRMLGKEKGPVSTNRAEGEGEEGEGMLHNPVRARGV